jgi:hypothetical protein
MYLIRCVYVCLDVFVRLRDGQTEESTYDDKTYCNSKGRLLALAANVRLE